MTDPSSRRAPRAPQAPVEAPVEAHPLPPLPPEPAAGPPGGGLGPIPGFTRPAPGRPWYKRWALWVVVLAAAIIADLPKPQSDTQKAAVVAAVLKEISTDVHPCEYAVSEAFRTFYDPVTHDTLPAASRTFAHQYLSQDQQACSFVNTGIFGMSTITVPNSAAGRQLSAIIKTALEWCTSDANGAIADIETLVTQPGDRAALEDLATRERLLAADRAAAVRDIRAAEAALDGLPLPSIGLPSLPHPTASSS